MRVFLMSLLSVALLGCQGDEEVVRTPQLVPIHNLYKVGYEETCKDLLPEAERAVEKLTGDDVSPQIRFVDMVPNSQQAVAYRVGNSINIKRSYAQVAVREQLYNTLCHEMLHMTYSADIFNNVFNLTGEQAVLLRVRMAFDEALAWRYAAELTAKKFGGRPRYCWDYIPASIVPRHVVVRTVMEDPKTSIWIVQDEKAAASYLQGHSRGRNKRRGRR